MFRKSAFLVGEGKEHYQWSSVGKNIFAIFLVLSLWGFCLPFRSIVGWLSVLFRSFVFPESARNGYSLNMEY